MQKPKKKTAARDQPQLQIDEVTRLRLMYYDAAARAARNEYLLKATALESHIRRIDPDGVIRKVQKELTSLNEISALNTRNYNELCSEVSKSLNINLSEYALDQKTGTLVAVGGSKPPEGPKEAAMPAAAEAKAVAKTVNDNGDLQ